ncbi:MAG: hypothetical protein A2175_02675 [Candidatus Nealsonbacteria bacterium RBG_13_42_11]|uniref:Uncharacterized protein n=1 Tax=Candidatus Nealsonbacteria bacterium RBG_13_42_11 TaxID=1801663 RepID=A0A1G2DZY2_9BACT|nr:MAG: hypothetical protein A2175_02675 [Candidatus Nealsonbacteria bacterium RBG_13_42_11]
MIGTAIAFISSSFYSFSSQVKELPILLLVNKIYHTSKKNQAQYQKIANQAIFWYKSYLCFLLFALASSISRFVSNRFLVL